MPDIEVELDDDVLQTFRDLADRRGMSLNDVIVEAIKHELGEYERQQADADCGDPDCCPGTGP